MRQEKCERQVKKERIDKLATQKPSASLRKRTANQDNNESQTSPYVTRLWGAGRNDVNGKTYHPYDGRPDTFT